MLDETQVQAPQVRSATVLGRVLSDGESGPAAGPVAESVVEMVAAQAATNPDATALAAGAEVVTYAELDRLSAEVARRLKAAGVQLEQLVGLSMERSPMMVIAALGIMKAGGAYVPLDATLPLERLEFMLRDADIRVIVTGDDPAAKIPAGDWRILSLRKSDLLEAGAERKNGNGAHDTAVPVTRHNLAYVIYTSGSTGQPKGVEITHGGLANLIAWHHRAFEITPRDRASQQAAVGFDAAVWEIWPYLAAGASVHITPEPCRSHPEALRDWLVAENISISFLATPLAERMIALEWPQKTSLRILLTGADTLHRRPSATLPFALINNYGPTECTVVATSGRVVPEVRSQQFSSSNLPSIGKPIDNTRIYIVDDAMREVPSGGLGELCIAGAGLARGYRNHADWTQERFIPNPFSSGNHADDARLYRTGDLARYLPNGEIEFLGRMDEQIKIRGFRIEPNEIVKVLDEHPAVIASAVVSRTRPASGSNQAEEKSLVAYMVLAEEQDVTSTSLRQYVSAKLPDYMIPTAFVCVESLPLTANGKIDRAALPAPNQANRLIEENFVAPEGFIQKRLAGILSSLLHVERIGLNDNFFLLGGHSLLGTQLIARVNEAFGVELPLLQLFDHPTLGEMSEAIEQLILAKIEAESAA